MFKDNLMMLRKMRGMTQEELAEKIDVSRQTLSKYEQGIALLKEQDFMAMVQAMRHMET